MSQTLLIFSIFVVFAVVGLVGMAWYVYHISSRTIDYLSDQVREKTIDRNRISAKTAVLETDNIKLIKEQDRSNQKIHTLEVEKTQLSTQLTYEKEHLQNQVQISQRNVERWRQQFSGLETNYTKLKGEIENLFHHNERLLEDNAELIEGNQILLTDREKLLQMQGQLEHSHAETSQALEQRKQEIRELEGRNQELETLAGERSRKMAELAQKLNATKEEKRLLEEDYRQVLVDQNELQNEFQFLNEMKEQLVQDNDRLTQSQMQLQTEKQGLVQQVAELQETNDQAMAENQNLIEANDTFINEIEELGTKVQTTLQEVQQLQWAKTQWEEQKQGLNKDLAGERESRGLLQVKVDELSKELDSLQSAYESSQVEMTHLQKWAWEMDIQRAEKESLDETLIQEVAKTPPEPVEQRRQPKREMSIFEMEASESYEKRLRKRLVKAHAYVLKLEKQNVKMKRQLKAIQNNEVPTPKVQPQPVVEQPKAPVTPTAQVIEFPQPDRNREMMVENIRKSLQACSEARHSYRGNLKSLKEKLDQARKDLYSIQEKQNAA